MLKVLQSQSQVVRSRIKEAFKALRRDGYFCRMDFWCCSSCGWAAVPEGRDEKVVFFHRQDAQNLEDLGRVYLAWSGDADHICHRLSEAGLFTRWDGKNETRILVTSGPE